MGRIYYGWWIVAIAMLVYMVLLGATFSAFGLFVVPVSAELGLTRAEMNTALILMNLGNAAVAPMLGRALDRLPVRWVYLVCALVLGLSLVILGLSRSIWLSAAVLGVLLPIGFLGTGVLTMSTLMARWFQAQRGRAMALGGIGMSLASVAVTPLVGVLIESQGWRNALLISGVVLAGLLGALALVLRDPGPDDVEPGRPSKALGAAPTRQAPSAPVSVGAILGSPQFWSIALSVAMGMAVFQTLVISLVPLGLGEGLSMMQATSLMAVMGGGALAGTGLLVVFADKIDRIVLLTGLLLLGAVLNAGLIYVEGYRALVVAAVALGVASAGSAPLFYALLGDRFGAASYGTVRGLSSPIIAALGMVAMRFGGEIFDRTGGYDLMFQVFIVVQIVAAGVMFATRFTKPLALQPAVASS